MGQMGHETPALTLAIYAREMDRRDGEHERLRALVEGRDCAPTGTSAGRRASCGTQRETREPRHSGAFVRWAVLGSNQ
jgi:hypothetical protein